MLWARMARVVRAAVGKERVWAPNSSYRIAGSVPEYYLSNGSPVEQGQAMSKGKQLRERLTGACSGYAIGDHKVPRSGWMVGQQEFGRCSLEILPCAILRDL